MEGDLRSPAWIHVSRLGGECPAPGPVPADTTQGRGELTLPRDAKPQIHKQNK